MQHESGNLTQAIGSFQHALRLKPSLYVPNLFLGIDDVRIGKAKEAIPLLQKAEKTNPADPLPSLTLGHAWSSLGDYTEAIREYHRSLSIDPKQSSAWFDLGMTQLNQVETEARAMAGQYASTAYAKALYAESLAKQSRYKEASSLYKSILASSDQPPCMQSEAGFVDLKQGDYQGAASQFSSERTRHPECSLAILGEARLSMREGANAATLNLLRQLWQRDHGFFSADASLLFYSAAPERAHDFLDYLTQQNTSNQVQPGLYAALIRSVQTEPEITSTSVDATPSPCPAVARSRAAQDYRDGHYALCAGLLRGSLDSRNTAAIESLAACSWLTGDYNLTYDAAHVLASLPSSPEAHALYWSIKANERLAFASLAHFEQLEPNSARSHILLGDIYRQSQQYDDAQKEYKAALGISQDNAAALLGLAEAYYGDANIDMTIATAQKALQQTPNDPEINLVKGEALVSQHNFDAAEPYLLKALNAKPQILPHVHALLGEVYAEDGMMQDAIRELKLGASSDQDGSLHYQLARLYTKIGDRAEAAAAFQQMKILQQRQREAAVVAVEDTRLPSPNNAP